jgi:hypothetical protein
MQINATLFVQAFNFLIAYQILKRLVFEPSVAIVQQERAQDAHAQQRIVMSEKKVAAEKALLKDEWATCHETLIAKAPQFFSEMYVFRGLKPAVTATDGIELGDLKKTQEEMTWALISSVRNQK